MEKKLKILKAVLLYRRRVDWNQTKEEQIAMFEKHYSDDKIDEWIEAIKNYEPGPGPDDYPDDYYEQRKDYIPSCTAGDYSPSHPWDAPGMSIRDFI